MSGYPSHMCTPVVQTSGAYIGVNTPVRKSAGSNPVSVISAIFCYSTYMISEYGPINFIF